MSFAGVRPMSVCRHIYLFMQQSVGRSYVRGDHRMHDDVVT